GGDADAGLVCGAHTFMMLLRGLARAFDDIGRENGRVVDDPVQRAEGRHERDIVVLDDADRLRVEHRAVLDRVDLRLRGDAHAFCAVRVRRDLHAELVRLLDGGTRLLERVLRDAWPRAAAEDAAGGEELDHGRAGMDLLANALADLVDPITDATHLDAVA